MSDHGYIVKPSVKHSGNYKKIIMKNWKSGPHIGEHNLPIGQYRWDPFHLESNEIDFIHSVKTITFW